MNHLVKIIVNEDGEREVNPKWHLINPFGDSIRTLCTGEAFDCGEYEFKDSERGITCEGCKKMIRFIKSIKL